MTPEIYLGAIEASKSCRLAGSQSQAMTDGIKEEIAYRGYLLTPGGRPGSTNHLCVLGGDDLRPGFFGFAHYYKSPTGIVDSGVAGFILGSAYLLNGRNLWTSILGTVT